MINGKRTRTYAYSAKQMKHYEAIVIGSSPLCLIAGTQMASRGLEVLMIDAAPASGGCWYRQTLGGGTSVEAACHLIENYAGVYRYLEARSETSFKPLVPQPQTLDERHRRRRYNGNSTILLRLARSLLLAMGAIPARLIQKIRPSETGILARLAKKDSAALMDYIIFAVRHHLLWQWWNPEVEYPETGGAHLLEGLLHQANEAGVQFRSGSAVDRLNYDSSNQRNVLHSTGASPISTERLYITGSWHISHVTIDGDHYRPACHDHVSHHAIFEIEVDDCHWAALSYIQLSYLDSIHRISDVSAYVGNVAPKRTIIIQYRNQIDSKAQAQEELIRILRILGTDVKCVRILNVHLEEHRLTRVERSEPVWNALSACRGIHMLPSQGDLARSIVKFLRTADHG